MAGGEGRRLLPVTLDRPKPMIDIGGVPLLERQVRAMVRSGLKRIFIATNYLGHVIEDHFGDGSEWGVEIPYLREPRKLGTAGALSLLPQVPAGTAPGHQRRCADHRRFRQAAAIITTRPTLSSRWRRRCIEW